MSALPGTLHVGTGCPDGAAQWCPTCQASYPLDDPRWRCDCGGHEPLRLTPSAGLSINDIDATTQSIWRYRAALRIPSGGEVSLGEGGTPLVPLTWNGRRLYAKLDHLMPTGSFKDRGTALVMSHLRRCGVQGVVEDSSGNAGASYAAYAAAADMRCTVFAPATVTPAKLRQVELYGSHLRRIAATRDEVARLARNGDGTDIYGGHNWQPFFIEGTKTLAYELWEELGWRAPDAVVVPAGGGSNLLGLDMGFRELLACGSIDRLPRLYGIQSSLCAPLSEAFATGATEAVDVAGGATVAEGIALRKPPRASEVLQAVRASGGALVAVDEDEITEALRTLVRRGFLVEPTASVSVAGFSRLVESRAIKTSERVVVVLTGSGLKAVDRVHELLDRKPEDLNE